MASASGWLARACRTSTAPAAAICSPRSPSTCRRSLSAREKDLFSQLAAEREAAATPSSATGQTAMASTRCRARPAEPLPPNAAFVISVAARLVGVHEQTLRYYERAGLLEPARSKGRIRLYSLYDLERVRQIRRLTDEMGVNLAGVEVIMRLTDHIRELEQRIDDLQAEVHAPARHAARRQGDHDMDMNRLTEKAQEAIAAAQRDAEQRHNTQLEPEHLLRRAGQTGGAAWCRRCWKSSASRRRRSSSGSSRSWLASRAASRRRQVYASPRFGALFDTAQQEAERLKDDFSSTEHFLLALADDADKTRPPTCCASSASPATACCRPCRRCAAASA